jgi:signal transduction histidine kinase
MKVVPPWRYAVPAVLLAVAVAAEASAADRSSTATVVADAFAALALGWVHEHPVVVASVVLVAYASVPDATEPVLSILPYLVSLAFVGRFASRRQGVVLVVAAALVLGLRDIDAAKSVSHLAGNLVYYTLFSGVIVLGGQLLKYGERRERELAVVARDLDAEAGERERRAVEVERARIARELHDVIAQALTLIGVHAAVARQALPPDTTKAATSLEVIETATEQAADDMRRLLGLLRGGAEHAQPTPSLHRLEDLVSEASTAGLEVRLDVSLRTPLPPGLELTAYRIVQEAVTNIRRHAPGSTASVRVHADTSQLTIAVEDTGATTKTGTDGTTRPTGSGMGLIGMRERAAIYGGSLDARPIPGGGFRLVATFPVDGHPGHL